VTDSTLGAIERLLVALLVGFLIGLDRERAEVRKGHAEFAGVRTFPLIALAGCIPMLVFDRTGPVLLAVAFLAVAAVTVISYHREVQEGHVGATTEVAAIGTFLLGALAGAGEIVLAAAAGVAVSVLLVAKPKLEAFSRALSPEELNAVLELAVISVIVLPLLPNRGYGPWQVLNPRGIWWVVVLVTALSFAGFVAVRLLGERRGLAITGAAGGLVSSTAVTMAMAERSREDAHVAHAAAAAAILASTVMCARVAVLAGAVNAGILLRLMPVVLAMALVGLIGARLVTRGEGGEAAQSGSKIRNPFSLAAALTFAVIYAVVLLVVRAASEYLGSGGMYAAAALSSVADVDAVTIAFARLGPGETLWRSPAAAVSVAVVMNTLVKLGLGMYRGSPDFRRRVAAALGAMAVAGTAAGAFVYVRL
jgi:uncharacterized membrane protein (DUF4010 family)